MARTFRAKSATIYLGDNGRAYCGEHLGCSAQTTGHDISGQAIMAITPDMMDEPGVDMIRCEQPGCGRRPSRLYVPA